ncbi:MAG: DUF421 domain-containing protein [Armatimonadota bacterium]
MFFDNWMGLLRVVIVGVLAYVGLVLLLRITGKRTLSKLNAFDLIVTVALGSSLATVLLSNDVALAEGLLAFFVLIGLQWLVAWASVRSGAISRLVKSEPKLLVYQGKLLQDAMRRERVVESEILQALRNQGIDSLEQVEAVVLETDGGFSVLTSSGKEASALDDVHKPDGGTL